MQWLGETKGQEEYEALHMCNTISLCRLSHFELHHFQTRRQEDFRQQTAEHTCTRSLHLQQDHCDIHHWTCRSLRQPTPVVRLSLKEAEDEAATAVCVVKVALMVVLIEEVDVLMEEEEEEVVLMEEEEEVWWWWR